MQSDFFFSPGLLLPGRTRGGCLRFVPGTGSVVFSPQTNRITAQMESGRGRSSFVLFHITDVLVVFTLDCLNCAKGGETPPFWKSVFNRSRCQCYDTSVSHRRPERPLGPNFHLRYVFFFPPIFDLCWSHARSCSCSPELMFASIRPSSCLRPGTPSVSLPCGQRQEQAEINSTAMKLIFKLNTLNPSVASRLSSSTSPSGAFHIDSSRSHWSRSHCSSLITTVRHW